jgi:hypothetical protein
LDDRSIWFCCDVRSIFVLDRRRQAKGAGGDVRARSRKKIGKSVSRVVSFFQMDD